MQKILSLGAGLAGIVWVVGCFTPSSAQASFNFSGRAGLSRISGTSAAGFEKTSTLVGGEFTLGFLDILEVGAFVDRNQLSADSSRTRTDDRKLNYALVVRASPPLSSLFVDVRAWKGIELGVGYRIGIVPMLSLRPEISYRTEDNGYKFVTASAMLTLSLL